MMFRLKKTESTDFEVSCKGYIKKTYRLRSGWKVLILVNHVAVLFNPVTKMQINVGSVKKVIESFDGKFMLIKKDQTKAVYDSNGNILTDYDVNSNLFYNGWYTRADKNAISLFDEKGQFICSKITQVLVFNDGKYFISVLSGGDAKKVGFFDADGQRIMFTNDKSFKRIFSYFVIADGSLYDINGECLIEANLGSTFNRRLVRFIAMLPSW